MKKLAAKSYWQQFEFTPEFVVIFLPGEIFYNAALQCDPTLIESGVSDNIVIATPMILIALLKAIAYGWRQDSIARSAAEISNLGRELYKRLGTMGKHFTQLRKSLESTVDCFNQTAGALESRVLPGARRFRDMGAVSEGEDLPTVTAIDRTPKALLNVELFGGIDGYRAAQADGGQSAENNGPGSDEEAGRQRSHAALSSSPAAAPTGRHRDRPPSRRPSVAPALPERSPVRQSRPPPARPRAGRAESGRGPAMVSGRSPLSSPSSTLSCRLRHPGPPAGGLFIVAGGAWKKDRHRWRRCEPGASASAHRAPSRGPRARPPRSALPRTPRARRLSLPSVASP